MQSLCPLLVARTRAVTPSIEAKLASAPAEINVSTQLVEPAEAAIAKAVIPLLA